MTPHVSIETMSAQGPLKTGAPQEAEVAGEFAQIVDELSGKVAPKSDEKTLFSSEPIAAEDIDGSTDTTSPVDDEVIDDAASATDEIAAATKTPRPALRDSNALIDAPESGPAGTENDNLNPLENQFLSRAPASSGVTESEVAQTLSESRDVAAQAEAAQPPAAQAAAAIDPETQPLAVKSGPLPSSVAQPSAAQSGLASGSAPQKAAGQTALVPDVAPQSMQSVPLASSGTSPQSMIPKPANAPSPPSISAPTGQTVDLPAAPQSTLPTPDTSRQSSGKPVSDTSQMGFQTLGADGKPVDAIALPVQPANPRADRVPTSSKDGDARLGPRLRPGLHVSPHPQQAQSVAAQALTQGGINANDSFRSALHSSEPLSNAEIVPLTPQSQNTPTTGFVTQTGHKGLPQPVAHQMAVAIAKSDGRATEIRLNPAELGKVRISLSTNEVGLTMTIIAERPETADLMRRNLDSLAQEFRDLGYSDLAFSFSEEGAGQDQDGSEFVPTTNRTQPEIGEAPQQNLQQIVSLSALDLKL